MPRIDLNADVGERRGDDAALLQVVTSANVAAGGHAGGGEVLEETVRLAAANDVAVGAHPSYPDRAGFGRVSLADAYPRDLLARTVVEQVLLVQQACARHGVPMQHLKAHGALYNDSVVLTSVAQALVDAAVAAGVPAVVGLPGSVLAEICRQRGVTFVGEAYADRAYEPDGSLVPRSRPGSVIHDPDRVVERVLRLALDSTVIAHDGSVLTVNAQTVCLHGDTPGAVALAQAVRERLEVHGVSIRSVGQP